MFKNALRTGLARRVAGRRSERKTKPSLEHLDDRIAPSGLAPVMPLHYLHIPTGNPIGDPFVVSAPPGKSSLMAVAMADSATGEVPGSPSLTLTVSSGLNGTPRVPDQS
jgi:hypothetical protein